VFIIALGIILTFWYLNSFPSAPNVPILSQLGNLPRFNVKVDQVVNGKVSDSITCNGAGEMPTITWEPYEGAKCYAIFVIDPDAPKGTFYHLVVLNVTSTKWPDGGKIFLNSAGMEWYPICPPAGETHRYFFIVLALKKCPKDPYQLIANPKEYVAAFGYVMGKYPG